MIPCFTVTIDLPEDDVELATAVVLARLAAAGLSGTIESLDDGMGEVIDVDEPFGDVDGGNEEKT